MDELIKQRIEINPQVMLGKPVITGTRIPVEIVLRKLSEGATQADLLTAYPRLTEQDIQAALAYGESTARMVELRQRAAQLAEQYGSIELLEARISAEGVPADDHTLYTDLLEWRAVRDELSKLAGLLESV